jgi:hypothetical protein
MELFSLEGSRIWQSIHHTNKPMNSILVLTLSQFLPSQRSTRSGKRGGKVSPPGRPKAKCTPSGGSAAREAASVGA